MLWKVNEEDTSPSFRHVRFPKLQIFVEVFRRNLHSPVYENAMSVHICGAPIWRPENNGNIWNLLWVTRRVIICTEQSGIYISTFSNALTSKKAQNHEISIYFSTNSIVALCHASP